MYSVARKGLELHGDEWPVRRSRARRSRRSQRLRRMVSRVLANLSLGILLVGCSGIESPRSLVFREKQEPPMVVLTNSQDPGKRLEALHEINDDFDDLSEGEKQALLGTLLQIVGTEKSQLMRSAAIAALANYSNAEAVQAIERSADDKSAIVRAQACKAFGDRKSEAAVETLGRLAQFDPDVDVRTAATKSLLEIGTPKCQPFLVECLRDKEVGVARLAHSGVQKGQSVDLGLNRDAWAAYFKDGKIPEKVENVAAKPDTSFFGKILR